MSEKTDLQYAMARIESLAKDLAIQQIRTHEQYERALGAE